MNSNWGGARENAGRPKGDDKIKVSFRIDPILKQEMDRRCPKRGDKTEFINNAIEKYLKELC